MATTAPSFAVVVPTCGEAATIERCLQAVRAAAGPWEVDIVVSDSGCDETASIAATMGARVIVGPRGRGGQLQRGATTARGEVLLFLHADTLLPTNAFELIAAALARPEVVGGAFRLTFDAPAFRYRLAAGLANLRAAALGRPWGDQAQFCRRRTFEQCGGFPDWPFLEDVELVARLRRLGRVVVLPEAVVTSARRYRRGGLLANAGRNQLILLLFAIGVSPRRLQRLYW